MLRKATKAAFTLRSMLDNTASATLLNTLYAQLIEPILLYGVEQWLPYIHPRKVAKEGPTATYASSTTQLPTDQTYKDMAYAHYFLHTSTPTLAVRAELGAYPTYIPGIARLANYMSYLCSQDIPPLVSKAILVHKAMALTSKFAWWNNAWRILNHVSITPDTIHHSPLDITEELRGKYRIWWLTQTNPTHSPKLSTFRQFHPSFHQAPYLNNGPHYLRPQALRFRCSNHRLDIELGRHTNTPRQQRVCRFCQSGSLGDEYHVFKCTHFLDLQIYCDIQITSRPSFISLMLDFPIKAQRYISLVMSRIRHR